MASTASMMSKAEFKTLFESEEWLSLPPAVHVGLLSHHLCEAAESPSPTHTDTPQQDLEYACAAGSTDEDLVPCDKKADSETNKIDGDNAKDDSAAIEMSKSMHYAAGAGLPLGPGYPYTTP